MRLNQRPQQSSDPRDLGIREFTRRMPKVCANLTRLFRIIPPPSHRHRATATCTLSHPSSFPSMLHRHGRDISTRRSPPASCFHWSRPCETPAVAFAAFIARSYSSCGKVTIDDDKMACPVRDPASEQLNDYKKNYKVCSGIFASRMHACLQFLARQGQESDRVS